MRSASSYPSPPACKRVRGRCGSLLMIATLVIAGGGAASGDELVLAQRRDALLIAPQTLSERLADAELRLLDVRSDAEFQAAHIPGAQLVDMTAIKDQTRSDLQWSDTRFWSELVGGWGITSQSEVVVYGGPLPESARLWWLLKYLGCRNVKVLDGGWDAWVAADGSTSQQPGSFSKVYFDVQLQPDRLATHESLLTAVQTKGGWTVIDNRSIGEFNGQPFNTNLRTGHIPEARCVDWTRMVDPQGRIKPADQLAELLAGVSLDEGRELVTHCQSGGRAAVGALVLEMLAGRPARNYYGSWAQWSQDLDAPVVTGPGEPVVESAEVQPAR
jgi:thiosulfate/3-mercaptopyruvate sulfurtransferase